MNKLKLTVKDIAIIGLMIAIIEVCKMALSFLPNIETTTFWVIMFTLFFGWKVVFVIAGFILIEMNMYGPQLWVIMYIYIWPLLGVVAYIFRKHDNTFGWALVSGFFGLFFGALCAIPYFIIGLRDGGVMAGLRTAATWWAAGIPWDLVHCVGNFVIMLVLYRPVIKVIKRLRHEYYSDWKSTIE